MRTEEEESVPISTRVSRIELVMESALDRRRRAAATMRNIRCEGGEWPNTGNWWLLKDVVSWNQPERAKRE